MKPNWQDAPEWAQWLAMDNHGGAEWYYYETKPEPKSTYWLQSGSGKCKIALLSDDCALHWKETLEPRPQRIKDDSQP
jgi:hypothetical protein